MSLTSKLKPFFHLGPFHLLIMASKNRYPFILNNFFMFFKNIWFFKLSVAWRKRQFQRYFSIFKSLIRLGNSIEFISAKIVLLFYWLKLRKNQTSENSNEMMIMNFKIKGEEVIWEIKMPIVSTVLKFEEEHWRGFDYESGGKPYDLINWFWRMQISSHVMTSIDNQCSSYYDAMAKFKSYLKPKMWKFLEKDKDLEGVYFFWFFA